MAEPRVPPLPEEYEPMYWDTVREVKEIVMRIREERRSFSKFFAGLTGNTPTLSPSTVTDASAMQKSRETVEMIVPASKAGLIIGAHGDTLRRIEKQAQVRLQFDAAWKGTSDNERKVTIVGLPEDIEEARRLIMEKISEDTRGGRNERYQTVQHSVPAAKIGLIIGRGGETVKDIQDRSGARVFVGPDAPVDASGTRPISISGDADAIARATTMIDDILYGGSAAAGPTRVLHIPDTSVGAVMGKRAEILKTIIAAAGGIKIYIEHANVPGTSVREVQLTGPLDMCDYAAQLINERVAGHQNGVYGDVSAPGSILEDGPEHRGSGVIYQAPGELAAQPLYAADPSTAGYYEGYDPAALAAYYAQYYPNYYYDPQQSQSQPPPEEPRQ